MDLELLRKLPKIALHDHLDGGLRPETVREHLAEIGHECPSDQAQVLGEWFYESANSGSLPAYLQTFEYTVAAMRSREHVVRVAREAVLDLAQDGVVYAELRWAPEQHVSKSFSLTDAVEAARDGLAEGMAQAVVQFGQWIEARQILTAMRHADPSPEIAQLALAYRDDSVVGFDIAGAEEGFPASRFMKAFELLRRNCLPFTIHAGEACGPEAVLEAVQLCGANRVGHGVRIIEDIDFSGKVPKLGRLAQFVLDQQIPLEICPTSNLQTGAANTLAEHPVGRLFDLGFNVSISCDNRLMSGTTMSLELKKMVDTFGWDKHDLERIAVDAITASFLHHDKKQELLADVILPGYDD